MKLFKLKCVIVLLMFFSLWSCQLEDAISNSNNANDSGKKHPFPDGLPSVADDMYSFKTKQYYHNGKVIKDTMKIKEMLKNCLGLFEMGDKKEIFMTVEEVNKHRNKFDSNKATTSLDGDNYLHYFYEATHKFSSGFCNHFYFNRIGPRIYNTVQTGMNLSIYHDKSLTDNIVPTYLFDNNVDTYSNTYLKTINYYLFRSGSPAGDLTKVDFTINVINTTRNTRKVKFQSTGGRFIEFTLSPGERKELNGSHSPGRDELNGMSFTINNHTSDLFYYN